MRPKKRGRLWVYEEVMLYASHHHPSLTPLTTLTKWNGGGKCKVRVPT